MYIFLSALILIASVLLIGVVLIQKSKGGGLASSFQNSNQLMGVRKTTDFVEKATWTLAATVAVLSILTAFVGKTTTVQEAQVVAPATEQTAPAAIPTATDAAPAAQTPAPAQQPASK